MSDTEDSVINDLFPVTFFLDTNILEKLPENLESGELSALIDAAKQFNQRVLVPDIVRRELCWHRVRAVLAKAKAAHEALIHVRRYSANAPEFQPDLAKLRRLAYRATAKWLRATGMQVARTPQIDIRSTVRRAVECVPPFSSEDRGFKDELIVRTIEDSRDARRCAAVVFVSEDKHFQPEEIRARIKVGGPKLIVVQSLQEAIKLLDQRLEEGVRRLKLHSEEQIRTLAMAHWDDICKGLVAQIEERGIPEVMLRHAAGGLPLISTIRRILHVKPIDLDSVAVGKENEDAGRTLITLRVNCRVTVHTREIAGLSSVFRAVRMEETETGAIVPRDEDTVRVLDMILPVEVTAVQGRNQWKDLMFPISLSTGSGNARDTPGTRG